MLIKINPPTDEEISLMKEKTALLAVLNPFSTRSLFPCLLQRT